MNMSTARYLYRCENAYEYQVPGTRSSGYIPVEDSSVIHLHIREPRAFIFMLIKETLGNPFADASFGKIAAP